MQPRALVPASVRVPCSTSNLGAGFDCIGLALARHLHVAYEPGAAPVRIERAGTLAFQTHDAGDDAIVRALATGLAARGVSGFGGVLRATSGIPVSRGLGSSAAATVAGLALAAAALGEPFERESALEAAAALEGHPDNAAPALHGGLVAIATGADGRPRAFPLPLSDRIGFAFAAPPVEIATAYARRVLPASVPHATAVRALGRVAALVRGLAEGDPELLRTGFTDALHVPYRMPLIPGAADAVAAALDADAWAVTVSGSGSGLIAVCPAGTEDRVAERMLEAFGAAGALAGAGRALAGEDAGVGFAVRVDMDGVRIEGA
ncbi:MAG: homoserine kinase [Gemmatimonadota bacterium]|jgi:homoserine kinase